MQRENRDNTSETTLAKKPFWTLARFLIVNGLLLLLLFAGLQVRGVSFVAGTFLGFAISSALIWYLTIGILWWVVLATYGTGGLKKRNFLGRHPAGLILSAWIVALIPAWLLFVFGMGFYVMVNNALA